jgi:hypothetical protein
LPGILFSARIYEQVSEKGDEVKLCRMFRNCLFKSCLFSRASETAKGCPWVVELSEYFVLAFPEQVEGHVSIVAVEQI